jgi:hypothetical protein
MTFCDQVCYALHGKILAEPKTLSVKHGSKQAPRYQLTLNPALMAWLVLGPSMSPS